MSMQLSQCTSCDCPVDQMYCRNIKQIIQPSVQQAWPTEHNSIGSGNVLVHHSKLIPMEASERKFRDIEVVAFGAETVNLLVTQRVIGNFTDRRKLLQRLW